MGDDEEYVFEEDPNQGEEEEETWETEVENNYANGKSLMNEKPKEAVAVFQQVIKDDQDKGRWTFKALKQLVRTYLRHKDYDNMVPAFEKAINFTWRDRNRTDIEKAINKTLDRCGSVDPGTMGKMYEVTVRMLEKEIKNYGTLWFTTKMKALQLLFDNKDYDSVKRQLGPLTEWCWEGENAETRKASQMLQVIAMEIELCSINNDYAKLRDLYGRANAIKTAIPPPKTMGIIRECGGKMFMRQSQWKDANDAFNQAFRSFEECGHPRRISSLKYLVLATMLSASTISPFATPETRAYQNDPEIVAMTELVDACGKSDVKQFDKVLRDKRNSKSILEDTFLMHYLEPLMRQVRIQGITQLTKAYTSIKMSYIATELNMTTPEVQALVVSMILDKILLGSIDQINGLVTVNSNASNQDPRYSYLSKWAVQQQQLHWAVSQRLLSQI